MNKTSTRVEALWDVSRSQSLDEDQRARILERLARRIDSDGVLRVAASERRSQLRNRETALARMNVLVQAALERPRPRKPTKPPPAADERRLEAKRRRGALKRQRRPTDAEE